MILTATPDPASGSVFISGTEMPQGLATVYRYNADGTNTILRGAQNMAIVNGVMFAQDPEAAYNIPLRYVVLMNMGDRVVQRNLLTNPSFETDWNNWQPGTNRTNTRVVPELANTNEGDAFSGNYVLEVSDRVPSGGESTIVPYSAPLERVNANFYSSVAPEQYEFSFNARLVENTSSYFTDANVVTGGALVAWQDDYDMFPSWAFPASAGLTWADLETANIGIVGVWYPITTSAATGWSTTRATWDNVNTLTVDPDVTALRARNYVGNPSFNVSTAGYTAAAVSGTPPTLSMLTLADGNQVMQVTTLAGSTGLGSGLFGSGSFGGDATLGTSGYGDGTWGTGSWGGDVVAGGATSTGPSFSFSANNLAIGLDYVVRLDGRLSTGQQLNITAQSGTVVSPGITSDDSEDWLTDSVIFTATSTLETFQVKLATGSAGPTLIDHVEVSKVEVDYFDGAMDPDTEYIYDWVAASNASASERIPFGTLYSPASNGLYSEYEPTWQFSTADTSPVEIITGILGADDTELVTPIRRRFNDGVAGTTISVVLPIQDTTSWEPGWRPYAKIGGSVVTVTFTSRQRVYQRPNFIPYEIGVTARVLNPSGSVVGTSGILGYVTAGEWRKINWPFTLPATVTGQYRIEIVPELGFPAIYTTWQLDGAMLEPNPPHQAGRLDYLDGDSVLAPAGPGLVGSAVPGWLAPEAVGPYDSSSDDALIRWTGAPHASSSEFLGPSQVSIVLETVLTPLNPTLDPSFPQCEPIQLSDPTLPEVGDWFTLQTISELTYSARSSQFVVLNRRSPLVISRTRSSASGSLTLLLQTLTERQQLLDLVSSGRVLLMRNPNPAYPENGWYLALDNVQEARIADNHRLPYRKFTLEFTVVDRPGGLIAAETPPTWADVVEAYTSWGTDLNPDSVLANVNHWSDLVRKAPAIQSPLTLGGGNNPRGLGTYCVYPVGY